MKATGLRFEVLLNRKSFQVDNLSLDSFDEIKLKITGSSKFVDFKAKYSRQGIEIVVSDIDGKKFEKKYEVLNHQNYMTKFVSGQDVMLIHSYYIFDTSIYRNYYLNCRSVSIGRNEENSIVVSNPLISKSHVEIKLDKGVFQIRDLGSSNGTYVNGSIIDVTQAKLGDKLNIPGMEIIFGLEYISVICYNVNSKYRIDQNKLIKIDRLNKLNLRNNVQYKDKYFNRYPRRRLPLNPKEITIDSPPMSVNSSKMPLMLRMGSSMVMGGSAALMGNYTMLMTTLLFPFLTSKYTDKEKKEYEEQRTTLYNLYLQEKQKEIFEEIERQIRVLNYNNPNVGKIITAIEDKKYLWNRKSRDDDFLNLRIGTGNLEFLSEIKTQAHQFSLTQDELQKKQEHLAKGNYILENAPILIDLKNNKIVSVIGREKLKQKILLILITEICIQYGYDEVKIIFLTSEDKLNHYRYISYLPHIWSDEMEMRFLATESSEAYQLSKHFKQIVEESRADNNGFKQKMHYIIFAENQSVYNELEFIKSHQEQDRDTITFSLITLFNDPDKDADILIRLHTNGVHKLTYINDLEKKPQEFSFDKFSSDEAKKSLKQLSRFKLLTNEQSNMLPNSMAFLEMFEATRVEDLLPLMRWKESNPVDSLAVPIGVGSEGNPFYLDLHQKFQGPHGLVAGTTGSGKSEFLLTYILSLSVCYHPHEVSFVLIDYKGGGLAGAFSNPEKGIKLPHVAATITNLDGATIQRSIISIESELKRRQIIFNEAKAKVDEATMDIYMYQRLYRNGLVSEPVSHLFIIADEFAELKQKEPDFLDKLVSAARIGRSLGVHLILATQKPSGVVNDQILSNTKFRVCLKVQDKSDSMDMLGRTDAARLKQTGRFYLQVGYNEFFALGQSAWSGAPYNPDFIKNPDDDLEVEYIDNIGTVKYKVKAQKKYKKNATSQIFEIVKFISSAAKEQEIEAARLWLDPIPKIIPAMDNFARPDKKTEWYSVDVGLLDDPENQKQFVYRIDLKSAQGIWLAGEQESGKTTTVQTIIYQLAEQYSPSEFAFYMIDNGQNGEKFLKFLPHCGAFLTDEDLDRYELFIELIEEIITKRRKELDSLQVENFETYLEQDLDLKLPLILVVLENIETLKDSRETEKYFDSLAQLMKGTGRLGIQFLISTCHHSDLSMRQKQELNTRIAYQLKEEYEYSEVLGKKKNVVISDTPGRCVAIYGDRTLELQVFRIKPNVNGPERYSYLQERAKQISLIYKGECCAKKMPEIPRNQTFEDFCTIFSPKRIPIGYTLDKAKPIALPFKQFNRISLYFGGSIANREIIRNFFHVFERENSKVIFIKRTEHSLLGTDEMIERMIPKGINNFLIYKNNLESLDSVWQDLTDDLISRRILHDQYCKERNQIGYDENSDKSFQYMYENTEPIVIFFEGFDEASKAISEESVQAYEMLYEFGRYWNIYIFGCFYPNEKAYKVKTLFQKFNPENLTLLFSGNYAAQKLVNVPKELHTIEEDTVPNLALMVYRKKIQTMLMPCGELPAKEVDEDDLPIF